MHLIAPFTHLITFLCWAIRHLNVQVKFTLHRSGMALAIQLRYRP